MLTEIAEYGEDAPAALAEILRLYSKDVGDADDVLQAIRPAIESTAQGRLNGSDCISLPNSNFADVTGPGITPIVEGD
jgi:hypothetical protein